MGDVADLSTMTHVAGYQIPSILPTNYRVHIGIVKPGEPNYNPSYPTRMLWHSRFELGCCEGCGCCFPWCCVVPRCEYDKDVHDYIVPGKDRSGNAIVTLDFTEAFGCCGTCCGLEHDKTFRWLTVNGYHIFVAEKSEVFVFSRQITVPKTDRPAIIAAIVAAGLRPAGFDLQWF